jgi:hypothetical protein
VVIGGAGGGEHGPMRASDVEAFYLQELLPEKLDIELDYIKT